MRPPALLILALAWALGACDRRASPSFTTRDSAGVTVIEYSPGSSFPDLAVSPEPGLVLGGLEDDPTQQLYQALHALRLADGRIVVANQGTEQIRFYDPEGAHLRTVGREGGGPGEFRELWGLIRIPGDTLVAWDWTARRLTVYDNAGERVRVVPAPDAAGFAPRLLGRLDQGRVAIAGGVQPGAIFAAGTGLWSDSIPIRRVELRDGSVADTLGPYPGEERYASVGEGSFWARRLVLGRQELLDVAAGAIHLGNDRTGEVRTYDSDGRLLRIVRTGFQTGPVTRTALEAYRTRYLEGVDEARLPEERRRLEELPVAEAMPVLDGLFADLHGRVWLRVFDPESGESRRWIVLGPNDLPAGQLDLPARFQPVDAGEDYALFNTRDDLDVERLVLYRLDQPAR